VERVDVVGHDGQHAAVDLHRGLELVLLLQLERHLHRLVERHLARARGAARGATAVAHGPAFRALQTRPFTGCCVSSRSSTGASASGVSPAAPSAARTWPSVWL